MAGSHICFPVGRPPFRKPSSLLYYQDGPPQDVDLATWRLEVGGLVQRPLSLTYADLQRLPRVAMNRRTVCVCNWSVRHDYGGVLLKDVLDLALPFESARNGFLRQESIGTAEKGTYASTVRLAAALERTALLCDTIDGRPLAIERGFPVRFFDFGLYLYKCVKGLTRLEVTTTWELGEWEARAGYPLDGTIKPKNYWICDLEQRRFVATPGEIVDF